MINRKHFQSLSSRLSLWIVIFCAFVFISVLSANYFLSRYLLEEYVERVARKTALSTVKEIENTFSRVANNASSMASVVSASHASTNQIHQVIKAFLQTHSSLFGMAVALEPYILIDDQGDFSPYYFRKNNKIHYADLADKNYQYKNWDWYSKAKKLNAPVWSEPYLDVGGGNAVLITYSTPVYSNNKTFAGVATADIELGWLDDVVKNIKVGESGFGFIISKNDMVIAHPDRSLNMKNLSETKIRYENWKQYKNSKSTESAVYLYTPCDYLGDYCWVAIETLGSTGWKVVIILPEQELISKIKVLTLKVSAIAVVGLVVLLIVVVVISRRLTRPLGQLTIATQDIGAGRLDAELPEAVRADEIGALTEDFSSMRNALKSYIAELQITTAKQQKLESEIQIAREIQMSMVPGAGRLSIKQPDFQLFALLRPARSVGGDLYYYQQSGQMLYFIIGDVSDKGVPAALFMAKTITLYTRALKDKLSPGQTFTMMNDVLAQNNDACMFVTALCGSINLTSGLVSMSNAGHMNPIIKNESSVSEQTVNGETALGLIEGIDYPDIDFNLNKGSSIVMYTDGITEAHDMNDNQYTDEKLLGLVAGLDSSLAEEAGNEIIENVDKFVGETKQFDDITLMIIRYE